MTHPPVLHMLATARSPRRWVGGRTDAQADLNGDGTREVIVATRDAKLQVGVWLCGCVAVCVPGARFDPHPRCQGSPPPLSRHSP